ncbi:hypothetical protein L198_06647 [Cryptococcus wingfieldii CBS 7118]|uniref:Uncharacterized protein n=1 Tax=Cryptococcus wingfieldii CBS 7118 TaxID=1295528 RepID=A0A1E3IK89_9TREE|nr:hypothetical protein L198_06647 [Cryptococcus wingfieldii CBS 7118]ODN88845.1 hypothetical protein L198_06647 [Cryptococcus wingfieldii CBS 7118]
MTRADHTQDPALNSLRRRLAHRPDLLLAIAKRHSTNPLLHPPPAPLDPSDALPATSPSVRITIPQGSPTYDALGLTLKTKQREVQVDIPLWHTAKTPREVGQSVEKMGEDALGYYGIPENPKVTSYTTPLHAYILPLIPILLNIFLFYAPSSNHYANIGRSLVHQSIGPNAIRYGILFFGSFHFIIEPLLLFRGLWRYRVPLIPSLLYLSTVVIIGFGGIDALRRAVIQERIRLLRSASPIDAKDRPLPTSAHAHVDGNEFALYNIPSHPKITHYNPPAPLPTLILLPLSLLLFLHFAPSSPTYATYADTGRALVERYLGPRVVEYNVLFAGACHLIIEPLLILPKLIKHTVPLSTSFLYIMTVVVIGYGGIQAFDRAVYEERVRLLRAVPVPVPKKDQ